MLVSTFFNTFEPSQLTGKKKQNGKPEKLHIPKVNAEFLKVMECIKVCYWQRHVSEYLTGIRAKTLLPCFTPSGTFKNRSLQGLENYSKIVSLDFDNVKNLPALKGMVEAVDFTLAAFISPGRNGLKVFCKVNADAALHYAAFEQLSQIYAEWAGLEVTADKQCKDYSRLCFVSYDAEMYLNSDAVIYQVEAPKPKVYRTVNLLAPTEVAQYLILLTQKHPSAGNGFTDGNRNNFIFLLACNCNRYGLSYEETLQLCTTVYNQETSCDTYAQIQRTINSGYTNNPGEHSKFRIPNSQNL